ncbi:MAG: phage holin family protein [Candidatus Woesebacteria bacterium]
MEMLLNLLVQGIAVFLTAYILPGVFMEGFGTALLVAIVLGIVNAIIRPILLLFTLPLNILTLGLFTFIINALMIELVDALIAGFSVGGFVNALLFSLVLSVISAVLHSLTKK